MGNTTTLKELKTYQELRLECLRRYSEMALNLEKGDYTSKMNLWDAMKTIWTQYLYWKDKMEKAKLNK